MEIEYVTILKEASAESLNINDFQDMVNKPESERYTVIFISGKTLFVEKTFL